MNKGYVIHHGAENSESKINKKHKITWEPGIIHVPYIPEVKGQSIEYGDASPEYRRRRKWGTKKERIARQKIARKRIMQEGSHLHILDRLEYFEAELKYYASKNYKAVGLRPCMYMVLLLKSEIIKKKHCE